LFSDKYITSILIDVIYLFRQLLYTWYKMAVVAVVHHKPPYYALWWQDLWHFWKPSL